ncbi:hypothetical protein CRP01_29680 [Flavilitoribacter nigricans DSM 23189 = NBRC 102662]|uniref:PQ-loop repeat-containing protein n=1 Tax=Flavilitoribacter nigricans (strain ATCC 23147 / DSM 23189 / NBRC 102662 / NCIMB 1420 / SS-2) TaxID=1122177 RepID=A0A2D0N3F2_FLAN2|nr:hypothetical protein CRP01_29680 [Flavilitoribacter nigricans DSM 23189 = NBRC 102662]
MNFFIGVSAIFYVLSWICYWLPRKFGIENNARSFGFFTAIIYSLTLLEGFVFIRPLIWLGLLMIQLVFISYWSFRLIRK